MADVMARLIYYMYIDLEFVALKLIGIYIY